MGQFNLEDYAPVEERIGLFYEAYPEGRIITAIERLEPPLVVFRATLYKDSQSTTTPWATGFAYEKEGEGHVNRTSYIENCETSAIGRALANAGYHGRREGAPRPSREEMQKVERMGGASATNIQPVGVTHSNAFDLGEAIPVGKHKGKSWAELVETDPQYVEWAVQNLSRLTDAAKRLLRAALALHHAPANGVPVDRHGVPLNQPEPDGLPY